MTSSQLTVCVSAEQRDRPTFDEQPELVRDDWLDEVVKVTHVDAGVMR